MEKIETMQDYIMGISSKIIRMKESGEDKKEEWKFRFLVQSLKIYLLGYKSELFKLKLR